MKIIIFTTPTCHYCHALMNWLDKQDIKYEELDAEDPVAIKKVGDSIGKELEVTTMPTTIIGDEIFEGFDRSGITKALKKHGIKN